MSQESVFSMCIVSCEHYQSYPITGLDPCYSQFRASRVENVPVIRIFGVTPAGQKVCLHVHGVFPYISIPYEGPPGAQCHQYMQELATNIDNTVNFGFSKKGKQHVYQVELISAVPFYGYHEKEKQFLRIFFYSPSMTRKVIDLFHNGSIMNTDNLQPHEAHIPYILQFFIDNNLHGMNTIQLKKVKFRLFPQDMCIPPKTSPLYSGNKEQSSSQITSFETIWDVNTMPSDCILNVDKISCCELEPDCRIEDIIIQKKGQQCCNPGLAAIWEDERKRHKDKFDVSKVTPSASQDRPNSHQTKSEKFFITKLKEKLLKVKLDPQKIVSPQSSFLLNSSLSGQSNSSFAEDFEFLNMLSEMIHAEDADSILSTQKSVEDEEETEDEEDLSTMFWPDDLDGMNNVAKDNNCDIKTVEYDDKAKNEPTIVKNDAQELFSSGSSILQAGQACRRDSGSCDLYEDSEEAGCSFWLPQLDGKYDTTPRKGTRRSMRRKSGTTCSANVECQLLPVSSSNEKKKGFINPLNLLDSLPPLAVDLIFRNSLKIPIDTNIESLKKLGSERIIIPRINISKENTRKEDASCNNTSKYTPSDTNLILVKEVKNEILNHNPSAPRTKNRVYKKRTSPFGGDGSTEIFKQKRCLRNNIMSCEKEQQHSSQEKVGGSTPDTLTEVVKNLDQWNETKSSQPGLSFVNCERLSRSKKIKYVKNELRTTEKSSKVKAKKERQVTEAKVDGASLSVKALDADDYKYKESNGCIIADKCASEDNTNDLVDVVNQVQKTGNAQNKLELVQAEQSTSLTPQVLEAIEENERKNDNQDVSNRKYSQELSLSAETVDSYSASVEDNDESSSIDALWKLSYMSPPSPKRRLQSTPVSIVLNESPTANSDFQFSQTTPEDISLYLSSGSEDETLHQSDSMNETLDDTPNPRYSLNNSGQNTCSSAKSPKNTVDISSNEDSALLEVDDFVCGQKVKDTASDSIKLELNESHFLSQNSDNAKSPFALNLTDSSNDNMVLFDDHLDIPCGQQMKASGEHYLQTRFEDERAVPMDAAIGNPVSVSSHENSEELSSLVCGQRLKSSQHISAKPKSEEKEDQDSVSNTPQLSETHNLHRLDGNKVHPFYLKTLDHISAQSSILVAPSAPSRRQVEKEGYPLVSCGIKIDKQFFSEAVGDLEEYPGTFVEPPNVDSSPLPGVEILTPILRPPSHASVAEWCRINRPKPIQNIAKMPQAFQDSKPKRNEPFTPVSATKPKKLLMISTPRAYEESFSESDYATPQDSIVELKTSHPNKESLTMMSLEIHCQTRGDLRPNPQIDQINAVFYGVEHCGKSSLHLIVNLPKGKPVFPLYGLSYLALDHLNLEYVENEQQLFTQLIQSVRSWDPDIILGYEVEMLSWGYLLERAQMLNPDLCSFLSRIPQSRGTLNRPVQRLLADDEADEAPEIKLSGRIVLNVWRLMRKEVALTSYTIENVLWHVLKWRIPLHDYSTRTIWFKDNKKFWWNFIEFFAVRVMGSLHLLEHFNLVGRTAELARLFGIQFYEVLSRGSQFRVESMMLRIAHSLNYLAVSCSVNQRAHMRAPETVPLILEPESKFYHDPVIVLDFQSLYPSIMIAYNYCYSTCLGRVEHLGREDDFDFGCSTLNVPLEIQKRLENDVTISPVGVTFVRSNIRKGVLPRMLQEILETRIMIKKSMKDYQTDRVIRKILDARQLGLKLIANVTYGYTGANFSGRMPCVEVADSILSKSRETLQRAIDFVEENPRWKAHVVYGDTDSMFVLLSGRTKTEAFKVGREIAEAVTELNPIPVKLKFEKVYLPCVLQTKKRYVGNMFESEEQVEGIFDAKGIETVRRDFVPATSKFQVNLTSVGRQRGAKGGACKPENGDPIVVKF